MGLWRGKTPLILASQSSARKMLLANAGLAFDSVTADIDERGIQAASKLSDPREIGLLLAREKAKAVSALHPGSYVIGADQTLALGSRLFNKPAGRAQALAQLRDLAGNSHELNSAVAVARDGNIVFEDVSVARMTMRQRPTPSSRPISMPRAMPSPPASAPISSRASASICSNASRATISPFSACRCCHCLRSCAANS